MDKYRVILHMAGIPRRVINTDIIVEGYTYNSCNQQAWHRVRKQYDKDQVDKIILKKL